MQAFELRYARYRGMAKTSLQHILTVLAINLTRLVAWWDARPKAQTRPSRFAAGMRRCRRGTVWWDMTADRAFANSIRRMLR